MKCISWNVNGLRACRTKGFDETFRELDADFFCIQESKLQEGQTDFAPDGWHGYWNYAEKKDIPEQPYSPKKSRCGYYTASEWTSTIMRDV